MTLNQSMDIYSDEGDSTESEIAMNQDIVDWLDPDGLGPINWDAMPPVDTWDAETVIIRLPL